MMQLKNLEIALSSFFFFLSVVCIYVHQAQMVWGLIKIFKIKFYSIGQKLVTLKCKFKKLFWL